MLFLPIKNNLDLIYLMFFYKRKYIILATVFEKYYFQSIFPENYHFISYFIKKSTKSSIDIMLVLTLNSQCHD